jgi:hypothetical protein
MESVDEAKHAGRSRTNAPLAGRAAASGSGVRNLRDGVLRALHSLVPEPAPAEGVAHLSRRQLAEEHDQLSRTVGQLQHTVRQLQRELRRERATAAREHKAVLDEQDRFLAELLSEHEAALRRLGAERDALAERMRELEQQLDAAHRFCLELQAKSARPSGPPRS